VVNTCKVTKRNQWAKVKITEGAGGEDSKEMKKGELMEVIFFAVLLLHL